MDVGHAPAGAGIAADGCCEDASPPAASAPAAGAGWRGAADAAGRLGAALTSTGPRAMRTSAYATLATTCAVAAVMIWTGPNPLRATGHDLLLPLDAAWRIIHGQIPHEDFYSPLGPVFAYWAALWMVLLGPVASIVHYSVLGHGVLLAAAAFQVGRDRLSAFTNWAFSTAVLLMAVAPFPVGWPAEVLDTAMCYNRMAFGIVSILAVEAALPGSRSGARPARDACLAGALLALLPLLKLNFAVIGAGTQLLVLLFPGHPQRLYFRALWLGLGAAAVGLLFFVVLRVDWQSFLGDMMMVRRVFDDSRPNTPRAIAALVQKLRPAIIEQLLPAALGVMLAGLAGTLGHLRLAAAVGVLYCFFLGADLAMGISNTQLPSLTLLPLMPLFALEGVRRGAWLNARQLEAPRVARWLSSELAGGLLTLAAVVLLLIGVGTGPLRGLSESLRYAAHRPATPYTLTGQGFESEVPFPRADGYPLSEADGLGLLQKHLQPGDKLVTLDFSNPFNLALGLEPARGDALWWHEGKTFSTRTFLPAERVFAEADWVIVAKRWEHQVMPLYGGFLAEFYVEVTSSNGWTLYKRRTRFTT
jgi:hypothetical protein